MSQTSDIKVYKGSSATVTCDLSGFESYTDYSPYLTIRKTINDSDKVIEKEGSITDDVAEFSITSEENDIAPRQYAFDVWLEHDSTEERYPVTLDNTGRVIGYYEIIDNVRY